MQEQKKQNELEQLKTEQALIASRGLTREILYKQFIHKAALKKQKNQHRPCN